VAELGDTVPPVPGLNVTVYVAVEVTLFRVAVGNVPNCEYELPVVVVQHAVNVVLPDGV
jgi:hypothetical protein